MIWTVRCTRLRPSDLGIQNEQGFLFCAYFKLPIQNPQLCCIGGEIEWEAEGSRSSSNRPKMVQRLTYRKRHSYATKSNQHRVVKTPGIRPLNFTITDLRNLLNFCFRVILSSIWNSEIGGFLWFSTKAWSFCWIYVIESGNLLKGRLFRSQSCLNCVWNL